MTGAVPDRRQDEMPYMLADTCEEFERVRDLAGRRLSEEAARIADRRQDERAGLRETLRAASERAQALPAYARPIVTRPMRKSPAASRVPGQQREAVARECADWLRYNTAEPNGDRWTDRGLAAAGAALAEFVETRLLALLAATRDGGQA